ncbi:hypothetical protein DYB36_003225 [Aphanomyces astaci]|uniref:EF-hand domain-containing protein n=1 Tax=Aphanomyces astaci TaxID=112090 RepID=A0A397BKY4_APHAT|nr:hypothetical protein DYB36_003225 [Aphanomyces astaci]
MIRSLAHISEQCVSLLWYCRSTELPREVLVRVLKKFDKQEKGSLTQSEFAQAIELFGFILTPQQLNGAHARRCYFV